MCWGSSLGGVVLLAFEAVPQHNYFFRVPLLTMVNPQQICYNTTQRAFYPPCTKTTEVKNGKKDMSDKLKLKGHMKAFMRWPLILSALLIVLNILVYFTSVKAGIIVSAGILIYVGIAVVVLRCHRPFIVNELIAFANQYDSLEKRILEELALPYAIMDMNGRMIWSNKVFAELTGRDQFYKKNINTIFSDVTADKLPVAG